MKFGRCAMIGCLAAFIMAGPSATARGQDAVFKWPQHDRSRPAPTVITPGQYDPQKRTMSPPSDAIVLFDGKDLSNWKAVKGGPARWTVESGYFEVAPGTGNIETDRAFGSFQLHIEWATPSPAHGEDQGRGNSGVFLQGLYEIQVLDSYQNSTYTDGQAGAIYGQYPPLVNVCRPPGEWQTYDVVFHAPSFWPNGVLRRPAEITLFQNGVLVQDHVKLSGPTQNKVRPPYQPGVTTGPLMLQDHHHPVRYRNVWIRELSPTKPGQSS